MIALLATPLGRAAVKLLAVAAVGALIFGAGYWASSTATQNERLKDTVKAHETRNEIDEEVGALDPTSVCIRLGGLPDECDKLRGLEQAPKGQ